MDLNPWYGQTGCFRIYFSKDWRKLQVVPFSPLEMPSGWEREDLGAHFNIYKVSAEISQFKTQKI